MTAELARKLAKELGFELDPRKRTQKEWQLLVKELESERTFNNVMDEFKVKKTEIVQKKHKKNLLMEVKNHKRNRIEIEIPVERSDPPTVNQATIQSKLNSINIADYTVSFSMTTTTQKLDDFGNLESEKVDTSPEIAINNKDFLKKYEKRTAGALTGFFNRYMMKFLKSLQFINKINLVLVKKVRNKRALTPNFDGMKMNCLIEIVDRLVKNRKDYAKKLQPRLVQLNEKYFDQGCGEQAIDEICTAVQVNIHVVSILQETWYHKHLGDNKRTILICSHNGHATWHNDDRDLLDFITTDIKTKKFEYLEAVQQHFLDNPTPIKFPIVIRDEIVAYYDYDGNLYKNRDIFYDEKDWKKNHKSEHLQNVFTLTSRYYKELKMKYQLQDMYRDENLYHFVKCADLYSPPWCTTDDYAEEGIAFDQTRAYMQYERSEFYSHYQFPRMPTHFYKVVDQRLNNELLQKTGFAQVSNVNVPKNLTYIWKTRMIQDNCVYTTMELAWYASLGVTFELTKVAFANDKQMIDFHIHLTEWQSNSGLSSKQEECSLMGRLIPNQDSKHTSLVHCRDENEFLQLRYQLGDRVLNVDFDKKIIYYTTQTEKKLRGAYHIHAYILAYQRIEFATKAMTVPFETILKVKVDCMVLEKPTLESVARQLHIHSKGAWAVSSIMEWMETMDHIPITEMKPFKGWTGSLNPTLDAPYKWTGFHEERDIKDCKTQHIDEVDFTHRQYKMIPDLQELPIREYDQEITSPAFHRFINLTGDAGAGKTYEATHWNLYDCCMLVPTHSLRVKFKEEHPDMPCMTYHKAFNTNVKKGDFCPERKQYSTYIMDECSMICKGFMNNILTDKNALNANMVLIHDRAQLKAVVPETLSWKEKQVSYFTYGEEFKKREWFNIHLTKQMRQNDPRFIETLTKMRAMHDEAGSLPKMIELLKDRIITEQEAKDLYRMDTKDIVIASTNDEVDRWNEILKKQAKKGELKLKYTTTTDKHVNNERVILQTEQQACQELAFASTVHIVQGLTFTDRLFISLSLLKKNQNFDSHLLYTAVSRVKSIDLLYLVK